jgi:DNA processing protein
MKSIEEKRLILALSILRVPGLRPEERLVLWDLVDDELSLSLLLSSDIEAAVGRSLGGRPWAPESYLEAALGDARFLERSGCRFVHYDDPAYPPALRETARPPFGLFARGMDLDASMAAFSAADAVAIVGTRMPTGRGLDAAFALARDFSAAGLPVVSGLARGIDAAAHRGGLSGSAGMGGGIGRPIGDARASGGTCAVLPCGLDRVYPPGNRALASAILEGGGLLLSEYPPGTEIHKYRFPERNRIIAGLCRACVVVEAPAKSGALITAEHALDEGRDVWVSGDCLGGQRSAGIDRLAAEGAAVLTSATELLNEWGVEDTAAARRPGSRRTAARSEIGDARNGR